MKKVTIGMLVFPRFQLLDIAGPSDAFGEVKVLGNGAFAYEVITVGTTRGPIQSSSGITITPDRTIFDPCPHFDTLLIPGGLGVFDILEDTTVVDWIARQGEECRRVGAICNGVFALGAAGMINGKEVTTHWMDVARLGTMFRRALIRPDHIYVKDQNLYTTAGVTAGIDLSLVLIEEDFGKKLALDVAKFLVVYLRRSGGQSQFSPLLESQAAGDSIVSAVHNHIIADLAVRHTLDSIAAVLAMSPRSLTRLFKKESGVSPMSYVNDARIDVARRYLESTELSYGEIAERCGLENVDALRRIFVRRLEITPFEYRSRFRSPDPVPTGI